MAVEELAARAMGGRSSPFNRKLSMKVIFACLHMMTFMSMMYRFSWRWPMHEVFLASSRI